ncbi:hypothetical protein M2404_003839 [Rheinheimera pacifica]|uniref:hypothetical protein n=1 Tax=Rheinheimera pacifica TaxID=173990 RepID=UPI002166E821|nr:hypothetical protein [Rheinheimera pacifica]MCS4309467.1 hypothetical protein [Rheinheimera pacifica]
MDFTLIEFDALAVAMLMFQHPVNYPTQKQVDLVDKALEFGYVQRESAKKAIWADKGINTYHELAKSRKSLVIIQSQDSAETRYQVVAENGYLTPLVKQLGTQEFKHRVKAGSIRVIKRDLKLVKAVRCLKEESALTVEIFRLDDEAFMKTDNVFYSDYLKKLRPKAVVKMAKRASLLLAQAADVAKLFSAQDWDEKMQLNKLPLECYSHSALLDY